MLLENSLKKFKETFEEFKQMFGLIGLTVIIIFSFMILNIFFGASDKSTEGSKTAENETVVASLPKGRLNFLYKHKNIFNYYQSQMLPKFYKHDGCCDCFATSKLRKIKPKSSSLKDIYGSKMYGVENNFKFHINIDTIDDWKLAEIYSKQIK